MKIEPQQAAAMACRIRDLLVRQRARTINALRACLARPGILAPTGQAHVGRLAAVIDGDAGMMPETVRDVARLLLGQFAGLADRIAGLDARLRSRATTDDTARRLPTVPEVGAATAAAITPFAPPIETFFDGAGRVRGENGSPGRVRSPWVGLTRNDIRAAARTGWAEPERWASATFGGC